MADDQYRGLLTEREREILSEEVDVSDGYYSRVRTRVRNKIEIFGEDLEFLQEYEEDVAERLRAEICDE